MNNTKAALNGNGWISFMNNVSKITLKIDTIDAFVYNYDKGMLIIYTKQECFEIPDSLGECYDVLSKGTEKGEPDDG